MWVLFRLGKTTDRPVHFRSLTGAIPVLRGISPASITQTAMCTGKADDPNLASTSAASRGLVGDQAELDQAQERALHRGASHSARCRENTKGGAGKVGLSGPRAIARPGDAGHVDQGGEELQLGQRIEGARLDRPCDHRPLVDERDRAGARAAL